MQQACSTSCKAAGPLPLLCDCQDTPSLQVQRSPLSLHAAEPKKSHMGPTQGAGNLMTQPDDPGRPVHCLS